MAKVDVIIPFFNTPREYIHAAVASVLSQTFTDFRCVVVNDGSSPKFTAELEQVLKEFDDSRILYVATANGGAAAARNAGIRATNSPYIALLDSDDMWHVNRLAVQVPILESDSSIALVHAGHEVLTPDGNITPTPSKAYLNRLTQREQLLAMLEENIVSVGTALFRRDCADSIGLFDEVFRNIEDKDFFLRLLVANCKFCYVNEVVTVYRHHASNKSGNVDRMTIARLRIIEKMNEAIRRRDDVRNMWPRLRRKMLRHISQEAAEKFLKEGRYWIALRHSILPRG